MKRKYYRPLESVLVKASGPDCNLNCKYCFYLKKSELFNETRVHRMDANIQEEMIKQIMEQSGESVSIAWQGGEPTLMGLDFYKKAIELEQKYGHGQMVGNGLQTNGILLTSEWADFLKKYHWLVGISLDGPAFIHDHYRVDKLGNGTHKRVEDNAKMLLEKGVEVNAMCCVSNFSVKYPDELYNYYKNMGLNYIQFIPIVETDIKDPSKCADFSVDAVEYGNFLIRLFDLWLADFKNGQPTTSIRFIESYFFLYMNMEAPDCSLMKTCGPYVVIEHNGNVYSCDFFVEPEWKLGNVQHGRLIDFLNSKKQINFALRKSNISAKCRQCKWLSKCYGGCVKDRVKDPQDHHQPRFCTSFKMFLTHADPIFRTIAEQKKNQIKDYEESKKTGGIYDASKDFNL